MFPSANSICRRTPIALATAMILSSTGVYAGTLIGAGASGTVNAGDEPESWTLLNGASLNVTPGGQTSAISATTGSKVSIDGGSINADSTAAALQLLDSSATVSRASIVNTSASALTLGRASGNNGLSSAAAKIVDSTISGAGLGFSTFAGATLHLENTQVSATAKSGIGGLLFGGTVTATNGTHIAGDANGLQITSERQSNVDWVTNLSLDQSTVEGRSGAAIVVDKGVASFPSVTTNITVANGSNLIGGNGNILEINRGNSANLTVDNSTLTGNVMADATSTANVTLQNSARLTGQLTNVANLAANSGAIWNMVADASVQNVALSGGVIKLSDGAGFNRLTVDNLSGTGTFDMRVDLAALKGDFLDVTSTATGDFGLAIKNTGAELPEKGAAPLQVVQTQGGDAQFHAIGNDGLVDAGAFKYGLHQQGNDWYLVQARSEDGDPIVTPSAESMLGLFNVSSTVWYGEVETLRSRMGDLRLGDQGNDVWVRTYGNRYLVDSGNLAYQQNQYGLSFGVDAPVHVSNGRLRVGVTGGYSRNDLDFGSGTTGSVDSYSLGGYATWMSDNGVYVDGMIKGNVFRNDAKVTMSDGTPARGGYTNYGLGTSLEVGRHMPLGNQWFIEPSVTLSAFVASGASTTLDNGLQASGSRSKSMRARLGAAIGRNFELSKNRVVQPYLKVGVVQEFARNNGVNINDNPFSNDLAGTRAEVGAGVVAQLASKLQLHGDVTYSKGSRIEQPFGVNFGVRYVW
ncbi:autotransporter outer membrane beta-barrel domain-containing protein [Burkholderia ubonensis]|uniref:autotransporter outer membrane beta-barrel domain-containing protein n=1 Tax=Burkholderia ubonensis TaxID=101571 RepID=UPI0009B36D0C|nr:autotransporter outer membrane beta-barrel domain-containing protein [Burkholderia ubonensis]